jgi:4,5-DOPA dioxygenase extradiol
MDSKVVLPSAFLAHGAPTLAQEGGAWADRLSCFAKDLPPIQAILVCSAHWETSGGFRVGASITPRTIHDYGGFPESLDTIRYPAKGSPHLAGLVADRLASAGFQASLDGDRGLDHGVWVPLLHLFPGAEVPVVPLSLPRLRSPSLLLAAGRALAPLREAGVLILGSGGLVHNLSQLDGSGESGPPPWALAFEGWLLTQLAEEPARAMAWHEAPGARWAVPTSEHLDPLWLALGAAEGQPPESLFEGWQFGSLSLRCLAFGGRPRG